MAHEPVRVLLELIGKRERKEDDAVDAAAELAKRCIIGLRLRDLRRHETCTQCDGPTACISLSCPTYWLAGVKDKDLEPHPIARQLVGALLELKIFSKEWAHKLHVCGCHCRKDLFEVADPDALSSLKPITDDALPMGPMEIKKVDLRSSVERAACTRKKGMVHTNPEVFGAAVELQMNYEASIKLAEVDGQQKHELATLQARLEESQEQTRSLQRSVSSLLEQHAIQGEELQSVLVLNAELAAQRSDTNAEMSEAASKMAQLIASAKAAAARNSPAGVQRRMKQLRTTYLKLTEESAESEHGKRDYLTANFVQRVFCDSDNQELWLSFKENLGEVKSAKVILYISL